jgi:hypothetical protein
MSEFQYYDFRSIDRPLTDSERREINSWSSRSNASSHRATFNYSYGDFGKNALDCVARYFDALFYTANWGTRHLIFRFPKKIVDYDALKAFQIDASNATGYTTGIEITRQGDYVLVEFELCEDDYSEWIDESNDTLSALLPLREDILNGDYRSLFAFWLDMARRMKGYELEEEEEEEDDDENEGLVVPPIPANLKRKTAALSTFIDLYEIDEDAIAAAATFSAEPAKTASFSLENALKKLTEKEKDAWLSRLFNGETRLDMAFKKHLESLEPKAKYAANTTVSLAEIWALADGKQTERLVIQAADKQNAHIKRMNELAKEEANLWKTVYFNLDRKIASAYDIAVPALKDLHDVAVFLDKKKDFIEKLYDIEERYGRSKILMDRLKKEKLPLKGVKY